MYKRRFWRLFDTRQNPYEKQRLQKSRWNFKPDARRRKPRCLRALRKSFKRKQQAATGNKTLQAGMRQRLSARLRTLGRLLRNTIETGVFLCEQSLLNRQTKVSFVRRRLILWRQFVQSFKAAEKSCYSQKYYISSCLMAAMAYENKLKNFMKKPKKLYSTLCERAPHGKEDFCAEAR